MAFEARYSEMWLSECTRRYVRIIYYVGSCHTCHRSLIRTKRDGDPAPKRAYCKTCWARRRRPSARPKRGPCRTCRHRGVLLLCHAPQMRYPGGQAPRVTARRDCEHWESRQVPRQQRKDPRR